MAGNERASAGANAHGHVRRETAPRMMGSGRRSGRYTYRLYGLDLEASFPLACLAETETERPGEVRLLLGDLPAALPGASSPPQGGALCFADKVLLRNPRASFYIEDGSKIRFPHAFAESSGEDQWFALHLALAHLLRLRGCIFLHASAVERDGTACLFLGPGGSGKSTIAAALALQGYRPLADDICAIVFDPQGRPGVLQGCPRQNLRPDALETLGLDPEGLIWSGEAGKFVRPVSTCPAAVRPQLGMCFQMQPDECAALFLQPLSGLERLKALLEASQSPNDHHPRAYFMNRLADVARHTAFYRLTRPRNSPTLQAALDLIEGVVRDKE